MAEPKQRNVGEDEMNNEEYEQEILNQQHEQLNQQQDGQEQYSQQYIMPATKEQADLLKYVLNPKDILDEIERNFRSKTIDYNTGEFLSKKGIKPMMNDLGIHVLMSKLEPYVSKIFSTAIFSEKQINDKMIFFGEVLSELLATNYEEFSIEIPDILSVRQLMVDAAHATLTKAKDGAYVKLIQQTEKRIETYNQSNQQNRSFLASFARKLGV